MQTQQQEERLALIDRVLRLDPETFIFSGLGGNVGLIYSEIERQVRQGAVEWMAFDVQSIHRIAVDKARSGALCANPRYIEAFQVAFSGDAAQKSGIGANEAMILKELSSRDLQCTPENILTVIGELWNQLADNPSYTQRQTTHELRAHRIAEMVGDPPSHGFSIQRGPRKFAFDKFGRPHDAMAGQTQGSFSRAISGPWSRGANSRGFSELSDDEVASLYAEFKATQDFRSMSVEDLRKLVRSNGNTDLFGKNVRPPNAPAPDGDVLLENPATPGKEFTRRDLVTFINAAPYNGRNLITRNGRIVPKVRQRFEEIIRGERG